MSPLHTFVSLLLSVFLNSECFKNCHKMEVFPGWKAKGESCCNWEYKGPPKREPHVSITALIEASPGVGWGSPVFPPSPAVFSLEAGVRHGELFQARGHLPSPYPFCSHMQAPAEELPSFLHSR